MTWLVVVVAVVLCAAAVVLARGGWGEKEAFAAAGAGDVPAYVISVPGTRPRDAVEQRFRGRVRDVRFFDGVDGAALGAKGRLKPGEVGCAASHMRLWTQLDAAGVRTPVLVFEDDAQPGEDFQARLAGVMRHVDDSLDVVFLGHCFEGKGPTVAPGLMNSMHPRCTHAYLLTPRGARTLAGWAARARLDQILPIDEELARLIGGGKLRALSCTPPIVSTAGDESLIRRMGQ